MARARGAHVIGAVRRAAQVEALKALGYDALLLPEPDGLADVVKDAFGTMADVICDTTGAWLSPSIPALARFGKLIVITAPDPKDQHVRFPVVDFYRRAATLIGVNNSLDDTRASAAILSECATGFASGALDPPDEPETTSLGQGLAAYADLLSGAVGKIALTTDISAR
jgi:NADPH:quinone reductase-like Zn-dependent oxidoreductase